MTFRRILLTAGILFGLSGCADKSGYDIIPEYEALVFEESGNYLLGEQYYKGEAVQITGNREGEVFLCRDGESAEVLMAEVPKELTDIYGSWWIAPDGTAWIFSENSLTGVDPDGSIRCSVKTDRVVTDICESAQGQIVVTVGNTKTYTSGLAVLDEETGELGEIIWQKGLIYKTAKGQTGDILILDEKGLYDYTLSDGTKRFYMEWAGTGYEPSSVRDIKFISSNLVELYGENDMLITLSKVNPEDSDKIILTLKSSGLRPEMKELIVRFNQENEKYYVKSEEMPESMEYETYCQKLQAEIAAGHGADIFDMDCIQSTPELVDMGVLEDLTGWMEQEGIRREDYFPQAFCILGREDGVYGMPYGMNLFSYCIDTDIYPADKEYDLQGLLTVLEEYPKDAVLLKGYSASYILTLLLEGSEDLNGLIDWENYTCDFSGDDFARLLELAKRYGDGDGKNAESVVLSPVRMMNYMLYAVYDNAMRETGRKLVGKPVAEGGVHQVYPYFFSMNAASANKEGVWEFMMFLLREENQFFLGAKNADVILPVSRRAFQEAGEYFVENASSYKFDAVFTDMGPDSVKAGADAFTKEQLSAMEKFLEEGKQPPWKTDEILDIIAEESQAYFDGGKTIEEVTEIMRNRTQLYLDEIGEKNP